MCVSVHACVSVCVPVCVCVCVWFASRLADRLVPNRLRIFAKARGSERERERECTHTHTRTHTHTHNSIKTLKKKTQDVARSCCSDIYWAVKTRPTVSGRWKKPRKWA